MSDNSKKISLPASNKPLFKSIKIPELDPTERNKSFKECKLGYESEEAEFEAKRCLNCKNTPCIKACPIHFPIPEFMQLVSEKRYEEAYNIFIEYTPFPKCLSRICGTECSKACTLGKKGEPLNIAGVKRFIADSCDYPEDYFSINKPTGRKVAIIGSGPSGIVCAINLAKLGHEVIMFEKENVVGGMLALGIPEFRLPKSILNDEIFFLVENLGIKIENEKKLGKDFNLEDLRKKENFDSVLIAIGAHKSRGLNVEGENCPSIMNGLDVLKRINLNKKINIGKKVGIVGGGNVAIDVARVCVRLGCDTTIFYRRTRKEMPANESEIREAEEEGVKIEYLTLPLKAVCQNNKLKTVTFQRMKLGELDASGRASPVPIDGSEFDVKLDNLLKAISELPDLSWVSTGSPLNEIVTRLNTLDVSENFHATNIPGVFASGDVTTGPALVINSVLSGKVAAIEIDQYLKTLNCPN
ncbi:MAG: FAD-dependent oxidoreductase [Candidatus Lokiarchaeota archaeon]|nr:FAD-dependent oxidoreductase [Candidatus Lokiarchaeota archaeon]